MKTLSYKDAGVDVKNAERLVDKIKQMAKTTYDFQVTSGVGGFASLYERGDRYLVAGTDGVGTKLKIAQDLDIHHTIGIDLVAMCANDVLCTGAKNLFFLDYLAYADIPSRTIEQIITGIVEGCKQAKASLIGGESAQMPGMYEKEKYDLAGFMVGEVEKRDVIDGKNLSAKDVLIGIASSGFHSNGFSLIRRLVDKSERTLLEGILTPTRIYTSLMEELFCHYRPHVKGLAHITGGGLSNIARINGNFDYHIEQLPSENELPMAMKEVLKRSDLSREELAEIFNMGVGMVLVTDRPDLIIRHLNEKQEKFWQIGKVSPGSGKIVFV